MTFWIREMAGWALVVLGLMVFSEVYGFCMDRKPVEASILTVVGIFIFRGGIHLLKVAVAARVATQARDRLYPPPDIVRGSRLDLSRRTAASPRS
jgi:hypothetical protein